MAIYAQSEDENIDQEPESEGYYEEEYIEEDDYSRMQFVELNIHLTDPTGALDRNLVGPFFGLGVDYLVQLSSDRPGFIGLGVDYTFIDNASLDTFDPVDNFPFNHRTTSSMGGLNAIYRHYVGLSVIGLQPFIEGRIGLGAMWTSTSVKSTEDLDFSEFEFNHFDASVSYGFKGGLHYTIADAIYITTKVGYMSSLSTEYDVKDLNQTAVNSSYEYFSRKRSTIDVIRYDLGVTFAF